MQAQPLVLQCFFATHTLRRLNLKQVFEELATFFGDSVPLSGSCIIGACLNLSVQFKLIIAKNAKKWKRLGIIYLNCYNKSVLTGISWERRRGGPPASRISHILSSISPPTATAITQQHKSLVWLIEYRVPEDRKLRRSPQVQNIPVVITYI